MALKQTVKTYPSLTTLAEVTPRNGNDTNPPKRKHTRPPTETLFLLRRAGVPITSLATFAVPGEVAGFEDVRWSPGVRIVHQEVDRVVDLWKTHASLVTTGTGKSGIK